MRKSNFFNSFKHAIYGFCYQVKNERNLKIHLFVLFITIFTGFYFSINNLEWLAVLSISGLVICLELFNSALEHLCDFVEPKHNQKIKIIKDTAAAAVFVAAAFAIIIGYVVFYPYFLS